MKQIELDKNFFIGGNATFTVDNGKGEHYTFKIKTPKFNESLRCIFLLTGPDNENNYTYLGMVDRVLGFVKLTSGSRMTYDSVPVKVITWVMKHVYGDKLIPDGYSIRHAGKCGCCGRTLTEPLSLTRGIGPDCWNRIGGL